MQGSSSSLAELWSSPISDRCSRMVLQEESFFPSTGKMSGSCSRATFVTQPLQQWHWGGRISSEAGREAIQRENSFCWSIPELFQQHLLGAQCRGMKG